MDLSFKVTNAYHNRVTLLEEGLKPCDIAFKGGASYYIPLQ